MTSASATAGSHSRKPKNASTDETIKALEERILHLERENQFLEGRHGILETEALGYRQKIETLLREVREQGMELSRLKSGNRRLEDLYNDMSKSYDIIVAKLRSLTRKGAEAAEIDQKQKKI